MRRDLVLDAIAATELIRLNCRTIGIAIFSFQEMPTTKSASKSGI